MTSIAVVPSAVAVMAAVLLVFALLRRVFRSPASPTWLQGLILAYASAIALTILFAFSLVYMGKAVMPLTGHVGSSTAISLLVHLAGWIILRTVIPLPKEDKTGEPALPLTGTAGPLSAA